jgi:hypothetical protein
MRQGEYGPYLSQNRARELEQRISELEGRLGERIDQQNREIAELRESFVGLIRDWTQASITALKRRGGGGTT